MRIVTWNINSLRLRLPLLERLIAALDPDVICLQETKVPDELFPEDAPARLGYPHVARRGMKGYNGVAILSRLKMQLVADTPDCVPATIAAICSAHPTRKGPIDLHDFYVPAGGDIPDPAENPKFAHKLAFVDEITRHFTAFPPNRTVLVGDLTSRRSSMMSGATSNSSMWSATRRWKWQPCWPGKKPASTTRSAILYPRRKNSTPGGATATKTGAPRTAAAGWIISGSAQT